MIDMGVGQEDGVDRRNVKRKGVVVQRLERLRTLKQSAIHQETSAVERDERTGPGDAFRRAVEGKGQAHGALPSG